MKDQLTFIGGPPPMRALPPWLLRRICWPPCGWFWPPCWLLRLLYPPRCCCCWGCWLLLAGRWFWFCKKAIKLKSQTFTLQTLKLTRYPPLFSCNSLRPESLRSRCCCWLLFRWLFLWLRSLLAPPDWFSRFSRVWTPMSETGDLRAFWGVPERESKIL